MNENNNEKIEKLIEEYNSVQLNYAEFTKYMKNKVECILLENGIRYQSINARTKDANSLKIKLKSSKSLLDKINDIKDINDLSGIRIIIYDRKDIFKITSALDKNLVLCDKTNAKKRYDAINITYKLKDVYNNKFKDLKCEVQVVMILSHALIEFEHDIFYKDKENIKAVNKEMYDKLKEKYNDLICEAIKIEINMNLIKNQIEELAKGKNLLIKIKNPIYFEKIKNAKNYYEINEIIDDLDTACFFINNKKTNQNNKLIKDLIKSLITSFFNIEYDSSKIDDYYMYSFDYTYEKILKILSNYDWCWIESFEEMINILCEKIYSKSNDNNNNKFVEMVEKIIDKELKNKKIAIIDKIYNWLNSNDNKYETIKVKIIIKFCDLEKDLIKIEDFLKMESYKEKVKNILEKIVKECIKKNKNFIENLPYILVPTYYFMNKNNYKDTFKIDYVLDYIKDNIKDLDLFVLNKIYLIVKNYIENYNENCIFTSIISNKQWKMFDLLFNDTKDFKEVSVQIDEIIENMNVEKEKDIIELDNVIKYYDINRYNFQMFFYNIGLKYFNSKELYRKTENVYILSGICNSDKDYKFRIDKEKSLEIINNYCSNIDVFSKKLYYSAMENYELLSDLEIDRKILNIIFKTKIYCENEKEKENIMFIIKKYNQKRKNVFYYLYSYGDVFKDFNKEEIISILTNLSYKKIEYEEELMIQKMFEKYPQVVRNFFEKYASKNHENSFIVYNPIFECVNYKIEENNNLLFVLKLLSKYKYYKVIDIIESCIKEYNSDINNFLKTLIKRNKYIDEIIILLDEFEVSLEYWDVYEEIINNSRQEIFEKIDSIFELKMFSEIDDILQAYKEREKFFKDKIKENTSNSVKKFIEFELNRLKDNISIYEVQIERMKMEEYEENKFKNNFLNCGN